MLGGLRGRALWELSVQLKRQPALLYGLKEAQQSRQLASRLKRSKSEGVHLGSPVAWYPKARRMKRRIICHCGPTNSGKTHEALQRLQEAQTGIYCGPLRLLAWEVYEKLNGNGVPCNLRTGQEIKEVEKARHVSCTVEMVDLSHRYEVAVVDECQLIGDRERGWAWTRALLGLPAIELHLCGSPAFIDLIQRLGEQTGDDVEVREYERLSPLKPETKPLRGWEDIQVGDCVVAFSRRKLFQLKNEIEVAVKQRLKCCIVYGGLPPDARQKQARLFNDADSGYDVLVASDAIGMGLNLSIGRVVFSTLSKFDGEVDRQLTGPEIKQIAGRAGRYMTDFEEGRVSAKNRGDLAVIKDALRGEDEDVDRAGLKATCDQLKLFAAAKGLRLRETKEDCEVYIEYKRLVKALSRGGSKRKLLKDASPAALALLEEGDDPFTPFALLLELFLTSVRLEDQDGLFFMCDVQDMQAVARLIEEVPLVLPDRYTFCIAPVDTSNSELMSFLGWFARQYAERSVVELGVDLESERVPRTPHQIQHLEDLHAVVDTYLWLGVRFGKQVFVDYDEAVVVASRVSDLIEQGLRRLQPKEKEQGSSSGGGRRMRRGRVRLR